MSNQIADFILDGCITDYPRNYPVTAHNKMPLLPRILKEDIPEFLIGCDQLVPLDRQKRAAVHFYKDDSKFTALLSNPLNRLRRLQGYSAILTPDLTLGLKMGYGQRIQNTLYSRQIGAVFSSHGLRVIPSLRWTCVQDLEFVLEGLEIGTVVSVSSHGSLSNLQYRKIFEEGLLEVANLLRPAAVMIYGSLHPGFKVLLSELTEVRQFRVSTWERDNVSRQSSTVISDPRLF